METRVEAEARIGEPVYPIYTVSARWSEDGDHREDMPRRHEGLPERRIWNSTSFSKMYREDVSDADVLVYAQKWWSEYSQEDRLRDKNPLDLTLTVNFARYEVWCGGWFNHWTFDRGQEDHEVLDSFSRFVERMQDLNMREGTYKDGYWKDAYCLMGAEDRWRWRASPSGTNLLGWSDEHLPAPCRCEHCKRAGIIRIDH